MHIIREKIDRKRLQEIAAERFGDMVKAVVDVERNVMAIGGELHADEEQLLLDDGSTQQQLWGINLYPSESPPRWVEFDSMINLRPSQGNRSRSVDDEETRKKILFVVATLVP